ncbi:RHS repeat-associated core domain-containing protein [Pseudomonas sp. 1912-s]|uniref:RHS repeat domain-containing protein n=1 Tax=Pseudomonas sp. 1912-s TaxID=3033802 RepID=UPI0023E035D6|nr:RHS repeat-associated core domain-containing protein [Pseudomonas sp. 1912-s]MDF3202962.1 RHS repeat-associated core domain-containing protein [Pseudomonas sp. 1912-s]
MDVLKKLGQRVGVTLLAAMLNSIALADTVTYFHNDISGSPMAASDAAGNLLWKENYKPYGEKLNQSAPSSSNKIGYHGKPFDDGTGLSYMGARYYDPVLGRFMGVDPQDPTPNKIHSINRYAYTNNNPYRFVDPDGREAVSVDSRNNQVIANMINSYASKTFAFNSSNRLETTGEKNNSGGSEYYSRRLEQAISSKNSAYIKLGDTLYSAQEGRNVNISDYGGAATTSFGDGSAHLITIGSEITNYSAQGGGTVNPDAGAALMHELVGHAIPRMVGSDTGNAVSNENKVRQEIKNQPLRINDINHKE